MCGPVCILCLATVYETRKWPAQTPITSYDWLCRVRAFARKSAIQAPSKYTNALLCVPTDEETFAWTLDNDIFLSGKDMAHPYWEYEMDHLGFTYMPPNEQDAEATKTFDFEGDMVDLTFIHEQCMTLLCDHLQQYALAHSIAGRCALETAWSCITGVSSNWALSRSEDEIPNPHLVCGKISEDEAWKFVDPFATATMLQDTTEAAIDAMSEIPYTLQDGASSASLFTPQETSYLVSKIWKARIAAEMPWVWKDLQSTFTNEKQDWAAIFHHLASLLEAPGPQFEDIMRDAPSLRNKLRICRAVKQLVSDMWAHELRMRLDLSSKPDWILNSFTLGAPPYPYSSTGASEVFFRTQEISQLSYVSVYLEKDGQISSLRFINEDGTYQVLGAHPEDIPAWEFQMNGGHITGAILSFQRLNGWNQKIRGIKLEINNGAVSPVMGIWDGDLIQFLRPGKDSFVTGFKYNIKLKFGISDILLMEFNPICTPKSKSCIESTFRNSSPLLRLCWPKEFPQESVQVQKCTGLEIQGVPVLPACFVLFDKFDPIHSIRVHISPGYGPVKPAPLWIEFLSNSNKSCELPIHGARYCSTVRSIDTNDILTFHLDKLEGERLISFTIFYEKILDSVGLDEVVDLSFTTNFGRSSPQILSWPLDMVSYEITLAASAGEEPCLAGIYSNNQSYQSHFGILTYRKVGTMGTSSDAERLEVRRTEIGHSSDSD